MVILTYVLIVVYIIWTKFKFNHLDGEETACCFGWFVFLVSRDCRVALPRGAVGLSAVCD